MQKKDWFLVFILFIATWSIDRVTKLWAEGLDGLVQMGPFSFLLHHNHGAMLGLFMDLPSLLRIVTLSTSGIFVLCIYLIIQYLLPQKMLLLRSGLSILIGGILGNVFDRIIWGYVVDFIVIGNAKLSSPAFNLADALQWVGYGMIAWAIIRDGEALWPEKNARHLFWVNKSFQVKYSLFLASVGAALTLLAAVFSYTYMRVTMIELVGHNPLILNRFLEPFVMTFSLICLGLCLSLFALGKYLSHRIAGPLFAFEKNIKNYLENNAPQKLKLRASDEFKHLEELSEYLQRKIESLKQQQAPTETALNREISENQKKTEEDPSRN